MSFLFALTVFGLALSANGQIERGNQRPGSTSRPDGTLDLAMWWSQGRAVGKGPVRFTHPPMRLEDLKAIVPYGMMVGGHVCPIDHGYFYPKQLQPGWSVSRRPARH
ncbi:MAG: hypothetical protein EXS31_10230 [Pedosphaera sp.]|nr:hypothetical protein [Pedosphaera sp.]